MNEPFLIAFILALVSEVADKTQLVILGLALKYKSPFRVFSGALFAHALMDGFAIVLGAFFGFSLSSAIIKNIVGILFIILGIWSFSKLYFKKSRKKKREILSKTPFAAFFCWFWPANLETKPRSLPVCWQQNIKFPLLFSLVLCWRL